MNTTRQTQTKKDEPTGRNFQQIAADVYATRAAAILRYGPAR